MKCRTCGAEVKNGKNTVVDLMCKVLPHEGEAACDRVTSEAEKQMAKRFGVPE